MDISIQFLFWFLFIALIVNRLIMRFHWKRKYFETNKDDYEGQRLYYLGFFQATLMALIVVSTVANYPAWLWS